LILDVPIRSDEIKRIIKLLFTLILAFLFCPPIDCMAAQPAKGSRELEVRVIMADGRELFLYKDYYALVVGVGEYDHWTDLRRPVKDAEEIAVALEKLGMNVNLLKNPTSGRLTSALNSLAYQDGKKKERAILFFFTGHGETETLVTGEKLGYIVPKDCPRLDQDRDGFMDKAISMNDIETYAYKIRSKHVLMVFDSCFSGSLFPSSKGVPLNISEKSNRAVRQFITAGNEEEQVLDDSIFKTCFIQGINGEADLNKDGYVTGSELGMYLDNTVVNQSGGNQHPQVGKIRHPKLNKGDFIFAMPLQASKAVQLQEKKSEQVRNHLERKVIEQEDYPQGIISGPAPSLNLEGKVLEQEDYPQSPPDADCYVNAKGLWEKKIQIGTYTGRPIFMTFVLVPGGCFTMGQSDAERRSLVKEVGKDKYKELYADEQPQHNVCLDNFWIGKHEITREQFKVFAEVENYYKTDAERLGFSWFWEGKWVKKKGYYWKNPGFEQDNSHPVVHVSWKDAMAMAKWLSGKYNVSNWKFVLPTEAQWEYACRSGTYTASDWGDEPDKACQYANVYDEMEKLGCGVPTWAYYARAAPAIHNCCDGYTHTAPAASFQPNAFGLHDMLGNVWEWCRDWYDKDFYRSPEARVKNPVSQNPKSGFRVHRGGSWNDLPRRVRCAIRGRYIPDKHYNNEGFRLVYVPPQ